MRERLQRLCWPADSGRWLQLLRLGLALQLLCYTWSLRGDWIDLFSRTTPGLVNRGLNEAILSAETILTPRLGWLVAAGDHLGLAESAMLSLVWWSLVLVSILLLAGLYCRSAAIVAWFLYLSCVQSGILFAYGVDNFTTIGLFYLMIAPSPDRWTIDHRYRRRPLASPERLGFHRRVLQFHLCLIYFFSGVSKCLGPDWWNGNSVWGALTRPPFNLIPAESLLRLSWLLPAIGILVCILEAGYPFFIWGRQTRVPWLLGILGLHLGIGLTMGLYLFAFIMIVLNLSAFAPDSLRPRKNKLLSRPQARHHSLTGNGWHQTGRDEDFLSGTQTAQRLSRRAGVRRRRFRRGAGRGDDPAGFSCA